MAYLEKLNWDLECISDILTKRGFYITDHALKKEKRAAKTDKKEGGGRKKAKKQEKTYGGIQSPRFATDYEDEHAFQERYRCRCGELTGAALEGETCPECGTVVEYKEVDMEMTGWIRLKGNYIIQPAFYAMLESAIGKKHFTGIIHFDKTTDLNGMVIVKEKPDQPFYGIGLIDFRDRFDEIMDYYWKKNKKKRPLIDELRPQTEYIFASNIPVYSSVMRPLRFKNETMHFLTIDRKLSRIYSDSVILTDATERSRSRRKLATKDDHEILSEIQKTLMELWALNFEMINQKDGHIRGEILGGRNNFSSRCVIIPDPSLRSDQIRMPYLAFLELYKYEIIAHLVRLDNITEAFAFDQWSRATLEFDPRIYTIMAYLVKEFKPKVLINRNPTINYGSMLCMSIVEVKPEYDYDFTMSIPIQILKLLNADFDGDVLNIISLKTKKLAKAMDATYNPRKNMNISRNNGLFNTDLNLYKDQLIGLSQFNNI